MSARASTSSLTSWQSLYHAALFETDRHKIPQRIADAETAILARVKELFSASTDHVEEHEVLDDALYALRALRSCMTPDPGEA
jgi:hypothetical protein